MSSSTRRMSGVGCSILSVAVKGGLLGMRKALALLRRAPGSREGPGLRGPARLPALLPEACSLSELRCEARTAGLPSLAAAIHCSFRERGRASPARYVDRGGGLAAGPEMGPGAPHRD